MAYAQQSFEEFGGLVLNAAPDEVGGQQAIDLLNMDFSLPGSARSRDGFAQFNVSAITSAQAAIQYYTSSAQQLIVAKSAIPGQVFALDGTGTTLTSKTLAAGTVSSFARFGAPGSRVVYGVGNSYTPAKSLLKYDGTTFTELAPVGLTLARFLAVQPSDNRLVAVLDDETVKFSAKGAPETWTGADTGTVSLSPGDGEAIRGIVSFGNNVIVFKESKFFVFYGNSLGPDGVTPVFNYRTVYGAGIASWAWDAAIPTPEAVYFLASDGVYATSGGQPTRVSAALDPLFRRETSSFYTGPSIVASGPIPSSAARGKQLAWLSPMLYVGITVLNAADIQGFLVLNTLTGQWSVWQTTENVLCMVPFRNTSSDFERLMIGTNNFVGRFAASQTTDNGTAITSRWRSGFYRPVQTGRGTEATIRETLLWGTGNVGVQMSRNYGALDTVQTVALGAGTGPGRRRVAVRGSNFSHQLSSVSGGAWTAQRLSQNIRGIRDPGLETAVAP